MHSTDPSAEASAKAGADLSSDPFDNLRAGERRREIASILAAGILRLMPRPEFGPEAALPDAETGSEESGIRPGNALTCPHLRALMSLLVDGPARTRDRRISMGMSIRKEVAPMQRMTVAELRRKYAEVFGRRPCRGTSST